jgi:uncharacterized protein (DUF305 family)
VQTDEVGAGREGDDDTTDPRFETGVIDGDVIDRHVIEDGDDGDDGDDDDDDVVVLSWWQHPVNIVVMLVAIAAIAAMIGWMVGDANAGPDPNEVDIGFLQDMREHHDQAVAMSLMFLALEDTSPGLRTVARSIVVGQSIESGRMIQLLRDVGADEANMGETSMGWMGMPTELGQMPGMATDAQLDQLAASSGTAADELFVELMTAHHEGGIHMAEFAAGEASMSQVRSLASSIVDSQRHEITELQDQLV